MHDFDRAFVVLKYVIETTISQLDLEAENRADVRSEP
jgi:hypothetical protein